MLLQDEMIKNKKGVSIMIGYVLLLVFAVVMGVITFAWLKSYVPAEALNCPEGVSIFINEATFNDSTSELNLSLVNNGRFDIAGYFIHASVSEQDLPTIDLSSYLNEGFSGKKFGNSVIIGDADILFGQEGNLFEAGDREKNIFNIPPEITKIYSIRITPTRFQEEKGRQRFVSCGDAKVQQQLATVPLVCIPSCTGKACGSDGCGGSCGSCNSSFFCDASGQCVSTICVPAQNATLPELCGSFVCGTAQNGTCGTVSCGTCAIGTSCNQTAGQCIAASCVPAANATPSGVCGSFVCGTAQNGTCGSVSCGTCTGGASCNQAGQCVSTTTQVGYFGFESGLQGWVDPGENSNRYSPRSKVLDSGTNGGNFSYHIQDDTSTSYTQQNFNLAGANQVIIEFWGWFNEFDRLEGDCIELKIDGVKAKSWGSNGTYCDEDIYQSQDRWLSLTETLSSSQYNFDSSVTVKFEGHADSPGDDFWFDGLKITKIG